MSNVISLDRTVGFVYSMVENAAVFNDISFLMMKIVGVPPKFEVSSSQKLSSNAQAKC